MTQNMMFVGRRAGEAGSHHCAVLALNFIMSRSAFVLAGGLEKLADIIAPSAEQLPLRQAALSSLQKGLKGVQAALESAQAGVFGEQVSTSLLLMLCSRCVCLCLVTALHLSKLNSCPVANNGQSTSV